MKTTFTHYPKSKMVELKQQITDDVCYIHTVTYGYSYEGLQAVVTGIKDSVWQIAIHSYTKTMGEALNKLQNERIKRVSSPLELFQSSTTLWK